MQDLENPVLQSVYHHPTSAPAHNLYTRGRFMYNANYIDGLRVVDIVGIDYPGGRVPLADTVSSRPPGAV